MVKFILILVVVVVVVVLLWSCCAVGKSKCDDCPNKENCERTGSWLCK